MIGISRLCVKLAAWECSVKGSMMVASKECHSAGSIPAGLLTIGMKGVRFDSV